MRLRPGEVAVVAHQDMDRPTAELLVEARPALVVNALSSITGWLPVEGASLLLQRGIPVLDEVGAETFRELSDGVTVWLSGDALVDDRGRQVARGTVLRPEEVRRRLEGALERIQVLAGRFVENTIAYAQREKSLVTEPLDLPPLVTPVAGRPAVVVVRGHGYRDDLALIRPFIRRSRPVLIGVDGGADALVAEGYRPDVLVGDMDSVSDLALAASRELVVHAYRDRTAPGLSRVRRMGRFAHVLPAPGTSEDVALLLAYLKGASPIIAVGTHTGFVDFLEKGRAGMASTVLVRMRIGHVLVDARGLAQIYGATREWPAFAGLAVAAVASIITVALAFDALRLLARLMWLHVQAGLWMGGAG